MDKMMAFTTWVFYAAMASLVVLTVWARFY